MLQIQTMPSKKYSDHIKVIAFDADDTLWVNEPYFQEMEKACGELYKDIVSHEEFGRRLYQTEIENLPLYGFGSKGFLLCMLETAMKLDGESPSSQRLNEIFKLGKELMAKPVVLLDGVREVLETLQHHFRLIVVTKGDLLEQERKLRRSGLESYFHHIEIASDKKENDYRKLLNHLDCTPEEFLMIGNSLKSDILPVLALNGHAIYIPYHVTWIHEKVSEPVEHANYAKVDSLREILPLFEFY